MGRHEDRDRSGVADWAEQHPFAADDMVPELARRHTAVGCTAPAESYPVGLPKSEGAGA